MNAPDPRAGLIAKCRADEKTPELLHLALEDAQAGVGENPFDPEVHPCAFERWDWAVRIFRSGLAKKNQGNLFVLEEAS